MLKEFLKNLEVRKDADLDTKMVRQLMEELFESSCEVAKFLPYGDLEFLSLCHKVVEEYRKRGIEVAD